MELKAGVQEIEEHPPDYARSTHNILKTFRNKFKNFSDPAAGRVVDLSDDQEGGGDPGGLWNADYGGVFSHIMASILADELSHHRAHCAHKKTFVKISGRVYYWDPTSLGERTRRWIDFEKQGRLGGACRILPFYKHKPGGDPGDGILGGGILLPVKKGAAPLFRLLVVWRDASSSGRPESELTGLGLKHHPPGPDIKAWGVLKLNEKHHAKFYYKEGDTIIAGHVTLR